MESNNKNNNNDLLAVREFLLAPLNQRLQRAFVLLAVRLTERRLRYLAKLGWVFPLDQSSGSDPIGGLAVDIVGPLLGRHKGIPFGQLYDYLRKKDIEQIGTADPEHIYSLIESVIVKNCHQELSKSGFRHNPQLAKLKRRIKDILKGDEYVQVEQDRQTRLIASTASYDLNDSRPLIDLASLRQIVQTAFFESIHRSDWCRAIFKALAEQPEFSTAIMRHELVRTMLAVNAEYVEVQATQANSSQSGHSDRYFKAARDAIEKSVAIISSDGLARFVSKNKLTTEESTKLAEAVREYLSDLAFSSGTDKLPIYFKEYMKLPAQERYLVDYKHIFETAIEKGVFEFSRIMRDFYNREGW